jgi:hypothetical protein
MDLTFYIVFYFAISPTWLCEKHGGYRRRNINWLPFANTWVYARCFGGGSGSRPLFWGWVVLLVFCLVLCRFLFLFAGLLPCCAQCCLCWSSSLLCSMLSLDSQFLIGISVFSINTSTKRNLIKIRIFIVPFLTILDISEKSEQIIIKFLKYIDVFFPLSLPRLFPDKTFGGVCVANRFSILCCPIMYLYILSSVLWCPLRFPNRNDVQFVITFSCLEESSCLIYVICICLRKVVLLFLIGPSVFSGVYSITLDKHILLSLEIQTLMEEIKS